MTIDANTGDITLPEIGASVAPSLARGAFLHIPVCATASIVVQNEPWCSYRLPDIPQPDTELTVIIQFKGERLVSLNLCHGAARFGTSWSDWSRERELARKEFHECWLSNELGTPAGRYPWGNISSDFDEKGGGSSITVQYR